ncbi:uncharacterized [Tachysurus ichikawai]
MQRNHFLIRTAHRCWGNSSDLHLLVTSPASPTILVHLEHKIPPSQIGHDKPQPPGENREDETGGGTQGDSTGRDLSLYGVARGSSETQVNTARDVVPLRWSEEERKMELSI